MCLVHKITGTNNFFLPSSNLPHPPHSPFPPRRQLNILCAPGFGFLIKAAKKEALEEGGRRANNNGGGITISHPDLSRQKEKELLQTLRVLTGQLGVCSRLTLTLGPWPAVPRSWTPAPRAEPQITPLSVSRRAAGPGPRRGSGTKAVTRPEAQHGRHRRICPRVPNCRHLPG